MNNTPFVETTVETAEMIKYAANAFLALKITYINEIANICEAVDANVKDVTILRYRVSFPQNATFSGKVE